jgi:membrane fusion protein, multidrug efflux system
MSTWKKFVEGAADAWKLLLHPNQIKLVRTNYKECNMSGIYKESKSTLQSGRVAMVVAFLLLLSVYGCTSKSATTSEGSSKKSSGGPAIPVLAREAVQKDVPIDIESVGTVEAYETVLVKSQVSGELMQVLIHDGDFVRKDQELFRIDSRTYQAQLNQAQATLAKDESALNQIEANLARDLAQQKFAQAEASRSANLLAKKLVSQSQAEQANAGADVSAATVRADQAAIQSARATVAATQAAVANVRVMFDYTTIKSPIDGRSGNIEATQGNIVNPNLTLTIINKISPIYIVFSVPESQLRSVKKGQAVSVFSQEDGSPIEEGKLSFIDNAVDASTGTIQLKALSTNKNRMLWPGEFVRVKLRLSIKAGALTIPNQAVQTGQDGSFVFVVKSDKTVESRPVLSSMRVGEDIVIEKGLHPGEIVVTEGQLRLTTGSHVKIAGSGNPLTP